LFGLEAGVSHEQHSELPISKHDDDRVFVDVVLSIGEECAARRENRKRHSVVRGPPVAAAGDVDGNVMERRFAETVVERTAAILLPAVRDRVDPQRPHDDRESTNMIAVGILRTLRARLLAPMRGGDDAPALRSRPRVNQFFRRGPMQSRYARRPQTCPESPVAATYSASTSRKAPADQSHSWTVTEFYAGIAAS
jgi:hypothetical protein